jgi:hypothetical protein
MSDHTTTPVAATASRRQFLLAGSAAVAGAFLLGGDVLSAPSGLQLMADGAGPRIPVAYIDGSAGATSLSAALVGPRRAVPAAGLRTEHSLAGRPARVSVRGFASALHGQRDSGYAKVLLDAHVASPARRDETLPVYAFTFRRDPVVSLTSPSQLRIASSGSLRVGFRLDAAAGSSTSAATTVFTSRAQRGLPTLQPGVYLLGLQQGMWGGATTLPAADDSAWAGLPALVLVVEEAAAV